MKLTEEDITRIFCLYIGCEAVYNNGAVAFVDSYTIRTVKETGNEGSYAMRLLLKPLICITEKDVIEIAGLAFVGFKIQWEVTRREKTGIWMNGTGRHGIKYYFMLNEYGAIYSSTIFPDKTVDHNIGGVQLSVNDGVPYLLIVDRLREMGYALAYKGVDLFKADIAAVKTESHD